MIWRTGRGLLVILAVILGVSTVASAEQPAFVVEETRDDGVYVASAISAGFDQTAWAATVASARAEGLDLLIVAPRDAEPDLEAFALRVLQAAEADTVLAFDDEGNLASAALDEQSTARYRAVAAAKAAGDPSAAADAYLTAFITEPTRELPGLVRRLAVIVFLLVLVIGAATFAEMTIRQRRTRQRGDERAAAQRSGASA